MIKTYKYKLYRNKRQKYLRRNINIAGIIFNHCIALHKRYYRIYGKHLNQYRLMKHIAKLRNSQKYSYWKSVPSQSVQDICQRIDKGYRLFFNSLKLERKVSPPTFKKVKKYSSITLKQAGWKRLNDNRILIGKKVFKYCKSRELPENIKNVIIKRDKCGDLWLCISCEVEIIPTTVATGKIAGCDFGLKTFLTLSRQQGVIESPQFFKINTNQVNYANRNLSRKKKGSNNRKKALLRLAKTYRDIAYKRNDWQWKIAWQLINEYDRLYFEDLNLNGMKKLWGRKISDLAFDSFLKKVVYLAKCESKHVKFIDRYFPSSKTCHECKSVNNDLKLSQREWLCKECGTLHDRDENAANNIETMGERAFSPDLENVRHPILDAILV